ncbi:MAG: dethiobiotin synthase [Gammaproteobacteria bacterium]|nr:dethiobiotin synthase [Gammaproteobacteria bacterium]
MKRRSATRARSPGAECGGVFVTGTDTGVGKTRVSVGLICAANAAGYRTVAMKPVSAGCEATPAGLRNDDALALQQAARLERPYPLVNPFAFAPPIAPHIAAAEVGRSIELRRIAGAYRRLINGADFCVVEGAGGWTVPLGPRSSLADLPSRLGLPVLLVVGIRLGCLNHALLTVESIEARGVDLAGWVANILVAEGERPQANIDALRARIRAPFVGQIPWRRRAGGSSFRRVFESEPGRRFLRRVAGPVRSDSDASRIRPGNAPR